MEHATMTDGRIALEFQVAGTPLTPRADTLLLVGDGSQPDPAEGWAGVVAVRSAPTAFAQHAAGCLCCTARGGLAGVLGEIFRQRAMGDQKWFTRVAVVPPPGQEAAWRADVARDVLAQARFSIIQES
ncbi:hypothetical protein [Komagataeibacter xylinus]|uniref:hypothetical protein n=1 Tax=Komagataeibacter xylinus TaxID=28448 RepID=UPI001F5FB937|nr:hypothetical protein [Komagataeibacter xylinus]